MSWSDVASNIVFWSNTTPAQWIVDTRIDNTTNTNNLASVVPDAARTIIQQYLQNLYENSATAREILDEGSASGAIRIGYATGATGSTFIPENFNPAGNDKYVLLNPAQINTIYDFNSTGQLVLTKPDLAVMHELVHYIRDTDDLTPDNPTEAQMNAGNFDFNGPTVSLVNTIALELGVRTLSPLPILSLQSPSLRSVYFEVVFSEVARLETARRRAIAVVLR